MNIRYTLAALLCAFAIGDSRAEPLMVDGEQCVIPDASYIHVGIMNDTDRFFWLWCVTRFNRYWTMSLDPMDRTRDFTFVVGDAKAQTQGNGPFAVLPPLIGWGEPATAMLEAAATNAAANDTHRPPVPAWRVQSNGTSKTRPGYLITDGKRSSTASTERVTVGVACDCTKWPGRAVEGKSVYCSVPSATITQLGALCTPGEATVTPPPPPPPPPPPVLTPPPGTKPPAAGPGLVPPGNKTRPFGAGGGKVL